MAVLTADKVAVCPEQMVEGLVLIEMERLVPITIEAVVMAVQLFTEPITE